MSELVIRTARENLLNACTGDPIPRADAERLLGLHDAQRSANTAAHLLAERARHTTRDFRDGIEHAARRVAEYGAEVYAAIAADVAAAPDFFQVGHTYTDTDHGTDWKFRCDVVTTHPSDGERTALGWRHFRGEWSEYAYGEDDFDIHLAVGTTTDGGETS